MATLYRPADGRLAWLQLRDHGWGSAALLTGEVGAPASSVGRGSLEELGAQLDRHRAEGFREYDRSRMTALSVVYPIRGNFPTGAEFALRNRASDRIEALLADTGLGDWTGATGHSGEMAVCFEVVDGELARRLIAAALAGTDCDGYAAIRVQAPEPFG